MDKTTGAIFIIAVCGLVLLMGAFKARMEWIINFVLRGTTGALAIYFLNLFLENQKMAVAVGINAVSLITSGLLGLPGLILLYGINVYTHFF